MRHLLDTLMICMLVALAAGVLHRGLGDCGDEDRIEEVQTSLARLREQALMHWAVSAPRFAKTGFPKEPRLTWFDGAPPMNAAVSASRPWIDVAPPGDGTDHPPDPIITGPRQAGFWYNPRYDLFLAHVIPQATEGETRALYNGLNDSALQTVSNAENHARQPRTIEVELPASTESPNTSHATGAPSASPTACRFTLAGPPTRNLAKLAAIMLANERRSNRSPDGVETLVTS